MTSEISPVLQLADLDPPSVLMMVGIPGSGKSYIARQLGQILEIPVLSSDACREELSGSAEDQSFNQQVWNLIYERAEAAMKQQTSAIIDATHAYADLRRGDIIRYRTFGARAVVAIHITSSLDVALSRNAARTRVVPQSMVEYMHGCISAQPPSCHDGFDFVVTLDNN